MTDDRFNDLIRPYPPDRERPFITSALHIAAVAAFAAEAIEAKGRKVSAPPAFPFAVFGIVVAIMAGQPCAGVVHPLLERCELLISEWRLNAFAHDTALAAFSPDCRA